MANIYLGQFNGASTSYGNYNGYFQYDDATRNGTTITLTNCKLYFERIGSGYTTNRIATTGNIAGKVSWDNITLNSSGSQSPASMTHDIGKVEITDVPFTTDKISLKVQAKGTGGSTSWGNTSGTVQLDYNGTISVPVINISAVTATNTNIGGETNITITRYNSNFTHKLYYKFDGQSDYSLIAEGITTSYKWVVPESVYSLIPNSNTIGCTIKCETYSGTTSMGDSTTNFTATVTESNPIFDNDKVTYKDGNNSSVAITNNNQLIVRNISELNVIISVATPKNYATITGYELVFNGNTQVVQAGTKNIGTVNLSQDANLIVRAVDSRGNKTELTKTVTISDWILPQAQITAKRINNFEDNTDLKVNVTISSVQGINAIESIKYRYKKTTDTIYSNYFQLQNNINSEVIIDKLYAWNFQMEIKDKFGITTYNFIVQKGVPIMFIDIDMLSVGIGKFPVNLNSLDLDILNGQSIENNKKIATEEFVNNKKLEIEEYVEYVDNKFIYSTTEQVVGKWTDGKLVYRKVVFFNAPPSAKTWSAVNTSTANISTIIRQDISILNNASPATQLDMPWYFGTEEVAMGGLKISGIIDIYVTSQYVNRPCKIIMEYTKTTN